MKHANPISALLGFIVLLIWALMTSPQQKGRSFFLTPFREALPAGKTACSR